MDLHVPPRVGPPGYSSGIGLPRLLDPPGPQVMSFMKPDIFLLGQSIAGMNRSLM